MTAIIPLYAVEQVKVTDRGVRDTKDSQRVTSLHIDKRPTGWSEREAPLIVAPRYDRQSASTCSSGRGKFYA